MGTTAFVLAAMLLSAWEWNARQNLGLRPGDIDDSPQAWAEARRAADHAPVAIIGDSRILFDTDQARFQALTGVRPVQVAHVGTNARMLLDGFADDPGFHGLLIVGMADTMYFGMPALGVGQAAVDNFYKNGKPAQLTGLWIDRWLQKYVAFMDSDYRLSKLVPPHRHRLAQRRRQSLRGRLEDFGHLRGPAICDVGSYRERSLSSQSCAPRVGRLQGTTRSRRRWRGP